MVTQGAREEHWRAERWAGLAESQPRASASLCSAPKKAAHPAAAAAPLPKQQRSKGWNYPPAPGNDISAPISVLHVPQSGGD